MRVFSKSFLDELVAAADRSDRRRQHLNLHESYLDPCQRLFNAIGIESYIRPHRHSRDPRKECLLAVRGSLALVTFDDSGAIAAAFRLCTEQFDGGAGSGAGCEIPAGCWHTVIAETPGAILLEVKDGPFDPEMPKEPAPWAPEEHSVAAHGYLAGLRKEVSRRLGVPGWK